MHLTHSNLTKEIDRNDPVLQARFQANLAAVKVVIGAEFILECDCLAAEAGDVVGYFELLVNREIVIEAQEAKAAESIKLRIGARLA